MFGFTYDLIRIKYKLDLPMSAKLISKKENIVTIQLEVVLTNSMLDSEENILSSINEAGSIATIEALKNFDTDGSKLVFGDNVFFSKGVLPKKYQTPYGEINVPRHIYQSSKGGKTFCPMEQDGRVIVTSTPRFAKMVSNKFSSAASTVVKRDLQENHGRKITRAYLSDISDAVGSIVQSKEESWHYETPDFKDEQVTTIALGLDGTCMLLCNDNYREAMTGTISLYNKDRERLHTIYLGAAPEHGKKVFLDRMEREINHIKELYPKAQYVGIADGAECNWTFLEPHVTTQILDFYHASGYIKDASYAAFPRSVGKCVGWFEKQRHELKHSKNAANDVLVEMKAFKKNKLSKVKSEKLNKAITYFTNHAHQMNYPEYLEDNLPIGSGVTEAACKSLIKQRLCCSGMKWTERGAGIVLSLRSLVMTQGRWEQFWGKLDRYGFPIAA